ncbi:MAG: proton-conducting transporter membrane subunit, partial [Anaerolineales bacterium]
LYNLVHDAQNIVALVGAVTALFAATIAVGQYDIKRVLAYSTISQLGFMVAAVGMGAYVAGMFHLITHAFFKALLFLSAGSVILGVERGHHHLAHADHHDHADKRKKKAKGKKKEDSHGHGHDDHGEAFDPGDMRNMGGMRKTMPVTFWLYLIGTIALAGIFPFAGFWSKDEILLDASLHNQTVYWLLTIAAFFTAFYMGRQIWMVFFGEARTDAAKHAEESPKVMTLPLVVLAILSAAGGALNLPFKGFHQLGHWLEYTLGHVEALALDLPVAITSTVLALVAILISWLIYGRSPMKANQLDPLKKPLGFIFTGMENKWYVDEIYNALIRQPFKRLAAFLADVIDWRFWHDFVHDTVIAGSYNWIGHIALNRYADQKGIDRFFNSWADVSNYIAANLRKIQNGFVRSYALSVLLGVVLILGYLIFK